MAEVTLMLGLQYIHKNRTFINGQPLVITNQEDLAYYRNNGHFKVQDDPRPVRKAAAAKPPEEETEVPEEVPEEVEPAGDGGDEAGGETPTTPEEEEQEQEQVEEEAAQDDTQSANKPKASLPQPRKGQFLKGGKRAP